MSAELILGAVAYDPKVVTIWDGFRRWFRTRDVDFDYVLYSHYERQVEDLLGGRIQVAWNSPLAWIRAERMARATGRAVDAVAMRDTDRDLRSVVVVLGDSGITKVGDLAGRVCGTGALDSPQATLLPLSLLRHAGLTPGSDFAVRRFDVGVGLHGDHIGGERDAARALVSGQVDACCLIDENLHRFVQEGVLPADGVRILHQTDPYDHCNLTSLRSAPAEPLKRFLAELFAMRYSDATVRPLMDLEGLKEWVPGRTSGYRLLDRAVEESGFYTVDGRIGDADYRP